MIVGTNRNGVARAHRLQPHSLRFGGAGFGGIERCLAMDPLTPEGIECWRVETEAGVGAITNTAPVTPPTRRYTFDPRAAIVGLRLLPTPAGANANTPTLTPTPTPAGGGSAAGLTIDLPGLGPTPAWQVAVGGVALAGGLGLLAWGLFR